MEQIEITVDRRIRLGKNVSRRLRREGKIPAIVYGLEKQAVPVAVDAKSMRAARGGAAGENTIFLLKMQGTDATRHVIVKDAQADPVSGRLLHLDFLRIDLTKAIEIDVPVHVTGVAAGIKEGGIVEFVHRTVRVECLPTEIPASLDIDVTHLHIGDGVRVSEMKLPAGIKMLTEPETVLAVVHQPKAEEVPVAAAAEEAAPTEPVVMAKGKEAKEGTAVAGAEGKPAAGKPAEGEKPKGEKKEKK